MSNHWTDFGDLVVEEKTLFRQVGWRGKSGEYYQLKEHPGRHHEPDSFTPIYEQIATWVDYGDGTGGWND